MKKLKHLDLFSGIGGFSLAAQWVWGKKHNIHSFVEIDPFCQKVLKKHWPNVPIISDIKGYKHNGTTIDLLTGGFPCQPFSCAGKRRGKKDDRYLWPEMLRIISEVRPTWIIGENVAGIINMGLDQVLSDLESKDYEVQSFIIPACAKNAPHRRDRVWIVANCKGSKCEQPWRTRPRWQRSTNQNSNASNPNGLNGNNAGYDSSEVPQLKKTEVCGLQSSSNSQRKRSETRLCEIKPKQNRSESPNSCRIVADSSSQRLQRGKRAGSHKKEATSHRSIPECNNTWNKPWLEVATRLCRMDDGLSRQMDKTNRLKALGNAIVPQVVVPIMQAIKEVDICPKQ